MREGTGAAFLPRQHETVGAVPASAPGAPSSDKAPCPRSALVCPTVPFNQGSCRLGGPGFTAIMATAQRHRDFGGGPSPRTCLLSGLAVGADSARAC